MYGCLNGKKTHWGLALFLWPVSWGMWWEKPLDLGLFQQLYPNSHILRDNVDGTLVFVIAVLTHSSTCSTWQRFFFQTAKADWMEKPLFMFHSYCGVRNPAVGLSVDPCLSPQIPCRPFMLQLVTLSLVVTFTLCRSHGIAIDGGSFQFANCECHNQMVYFDGSITITKSWVNPLFRLGHFQVRKLLT